MRVDAPIRDHGDELLEGDMSGFLLFARVVKDDTPDHEVTFSWGEVAELQCRIRIRRVLRKESNQDEAHENGEQPFDNEHPLPAAQTIDASHAQDAKCE